MLWPLRRFQGQVSQFFQDCLDLTLDIADSKGIFADCYDLITPALSASAIEQLLQAIHGQQSRKAEMMQLLSREFSQKVGRHPCADLPLRAWVEWMGRAPGDTASSLPFLLYSAFRTDVGRKLLELDKVDALQELHREKTKQIQAGNAFALVRQAARYHLLVEAVADKVARRQTTPTEARQLLEEFGGGGEEPDAATLLFIHSLVSRAGSMSAAGQALQLLLQISGVAGDGARLRAWAGALAKPEKAAGGWRPSCSAIRQFPVWPLLFEAVCS